MKREAEEDWVRALVAVTQIFLYLLKMGHAMPVPENFPKFEDIEQSRPDELGAEIVLDLQRTNPNEFFSPTNFPANLALSGYQREYPTKEFVSAVREAIEWARRELLLVQHANSTPPSDGLMLSRRWS
jgi:hypothetical protein